MILANLWAATAPRLNWPLRFYFFAHVGVTLALCTCLQITGWNCPTYTWIYLIGTSVALAASGVLVYYWGKRFLESMAVAYLATMAVAWVVPKPISLDSGIALTEAFLLISMGISLWIGLELTRVSLMTGVLAILWLLLGLYDFGFALYRDHATWQWMNDWVTYALFIVAFSVIAGLSYWEQYSQQERHG